MRHHASVKRRQLTCAGADAAAFHAVPEKLVKEEEAKLVGKEEAKVSAEEESKLAACSGYRYCAPGHHGRALPSPRLSDDTAARRAVAEKLAAE